MQLSVLDEESGCSAKPLESAARHCARPRTSTRPAPSTTPTWSPNQATALSNERTVRPCLRPPDRQRPVDRGNGRRLGQRRHRADRRAARPGRRGPAAFAPEFFSLPVPDECLPPLLRFERHTAVRVGFGAAADGR